MLRNSFDKSSTGSTSLGSVWRLLAISALVAGVFLSISAWKARRPQSFPLPQGAQILEMTISPDGKKLAVFMQTPMGHAAQIYAVATGSKICDLPLPPRGWVYNPKFPPGKPRFEIPCWAPDSQRLVAVYNDESRGMTKVPLDPTIDSFHAAHPKIRGKRPGFMYNQIKKFAVWNALTGELKVDSLCGPPTEHSLDFGPIHFSHDGTTLVGEGAPPAIFDPATGRRLKVFKGSFNKPGNGQPGKGQPGRGTLNEKLGLAAIANRNATQLQIYDVKQKKELWRSPLGSHWYAEWTGDTLRISQTAGKVQDFSPEIFRIWDGKQRRFLQAPPTQQNSFSQVKLSPDGHTLMVLSFPSLVPSSTSRERRGTVTGWDCLTGQQIWKLKRLYTPNTFADWSPDGRWLALRDFAAENGPFLLSLYDNHGQLHRERETSVTARDCWSPDSRSIALDLEDGQGERVEMMNVGNE